jgi:hypothetical protein
VYEKEIHQERDHSIHGLRMREEYMIAFLLNPSSVCMCPMPITSSLMHLVTLPELSKRTSSDTNAIEGME